MSPSAATAAPWRQAMAAVTAHDDAGAGHRWLELVVGEDFAVPVPGQFVQLLLAPPAPVLLPRPMSVAGAEPRGAGVALRFLYAPVGGGTEALARLKPGEPIEVLGPLGRGFPLEREGAVVLAAGGRGVAPLVFAADALARSGRRCELLFGARTGELLVSLDDAERTLEQLGGRVRVATDDGSRGRRGTVVDLLVEAFGELAGPKVVHACGPHGMLAAVARLGLGSRVPTFLAMESNMACGTGVCRGCPLPRSAAGRDAYLRERGDTPSLEGNHEYAMCCTEGPVFPAEALDWDRVH